MYQAKDEFFDRLFDENYVKIKTWAYRHLGDIDQAEDIAQETFLILVLRIDIAMEHPSPRAWLYKVAQNLIGHALRERKQKLTYIADMGDSNQARQVEAELGLVEIFPFSFSEDDKRILIMYYVEQRSVTEVADAFGISVSACKMRLFRLRKELKNTIENM